MPAAQKSFASLIGTDIIRFGRGSGRSGVRPPLHPHGAMRRSTSHEIKPAMTLTFDITLASLLTAVGVLGVVVGQGIGISAWAVLAFAVLALVSLGWLLRAWLLYRRAA
jgi:hypothetical protein